MNANTPIAIIQRSPAFSPNHIANDAAILDGVGAYLRRRGRKVTHYIETDLQQGLVKEPVLIAMCRERTSLALLQTMEDAGRLVVNSAYGIENCKRARLGSLLQKAGVEYPTHLVVNTNSLIIAKLEALGISACWVKRADSHLRHKEDITFAHTPQEAQDVLQEYFLRGIPTAEVQTHVEGRLVKFYGVTGSDFFFQFYPAERRGNEPRVIPCEPIASQVATMAHRAATALGVEIYGGDAIVTPEGRIMIINLNDWPSYVACRAEAIKPIGRMITDRIKLHK